MTQITFLHFSYVTAHSPTLSSLYLRHSSFPNPSVASPTSQFILQPFFCFSYVTSSSLNSPGEPPMACKGFITSSHFRWGVVGTSNNPPCWRTTHYLLSTTYSQLFFISRGHLLYPETEDATCRGERNPPNFKCV